MTKEEALRIAIKHVAWKRDELRNRCYLNVANELSDALDILRKMRDEQKSKGSKNVNQTS